LHPNTKAAVEDLEVEQIDVKTALLNGPLKETIYLEPPVGYDFGDKVLLLKKALYGLKQAARAWNDELKRHRLTENIIISGADALLFYLEREGRRCFLLIYVNDGLLVGTEGDVLALLQGHPQSRSSGVVPQHGGDSRPREQDIDGVTAQVRTRDSAEQRHGGLQGQEHADGAEPEAQQGRR
jgi:hypothetical protein